MAAVLLGLVVNKYLMEFFSFTCGNFQHKHTRSETAIEVLVAYDNKGSKVSPRHHIVKY